MGGETCTVLRLRLMRKLAMCLNCSICLGFWLPCIESGVRAQHLHFNLKFTANTNIFLWFCHHSCDPRQTNMFHIANPKDHFYQFFSSSSQFFWNFGNNLSQEVSVNYLPLKLPLNWNPVIDLCAAATGFVSFSFYSCYTIMNCLML